MSARSLPAPSGGHCIRHAASRWSRIASDNESKSANLAGASPHFIPHSVKIEWALSIAKSGPLATSRDRNKALAILCAAIGSNQS